LPCCRFLLRIPIVLCRERDTISAIHSVFPKDNTFVYFYQSGIIGTTEPRIPVIVHFHGLNDVMEEQISALKNGAVLCTVHLGNLSGPYRNYFSDRAAFGKILHHLNGVLAKSGMDYGERKPELILTSFSAGYAAVREILLDEGYYDTVRAVLLADGLHTDSDPLLMEQQMRSFLRYRARCTERKENILYNTFGYSTAGLCKHHRYGRIPYRTYRGTAYCGVGIR
jgi:hypothetical protein